MSRLYVFDAMALAYRAYYAFIGRPLTRVAARAERPGTARWVGIEAAEAGRTRVARSAGGEIHLVDAAGRAEALVPVPAGAHLLVRDGDAVTAGAPLLAENTSAIVGMANMLLMLRREGAPDCWALAWDGPGPTFRHQRFPDYKATRKPMPDDLLSQIAPIEDLAHALGLPVIEIPGMEADDVMATLARRGAAEGHEVVLVTGDKDMLQLVDDRVAVLVPLGKGEGWNRMDAEAVRGKWGVGPESIRDVLALMGDTSDNIPGVPGIGEKTAVELIREFGPLEGIYARLDEVKKPALRAKLEAYRELAFVSRELATLRTDLDVPYTWEDLRCGPMRRDALRELARRWEIRRLEAVASEHGVDDASAGAPAPARDTARRGTAAETPAPGVKLAAPPGPPGPTTAAPASDAEAALAPIRPVAAPPAPAARPFVAASPAPLMPPQGTLDLFAGGTLETAGEELSALRVRLHEVRARALHGLAVLPVAEGEPRRATLVGLALAARDGLSAYVPLAHEAGPNFTLERAREWLGPALADPSVPKVGEDLKRDAHRLAGAGLALGGLAFDVHLGSFLCDPVRDHSLAALARDLLGLALPPLEPPAARGRGRAPLAALPVAPAAAAAAAAAATLFPLADALRAQLESREQGALYDRLEHPLIPVLLEMERHGVAIDRPRLEAMSARAATELARLEERLVELAGERVNLLSGPQLSRVLFEVLKLKPGRRTKTGWSIDQEVLESLADQHPFPRLLLEYRQLAKLRSTYLEALPLQADGADGRVHTTFHQAGAATGRLSSSNPNLQNIPMRTEQGREIRRAFIADPGYRLVGADYSQIELRVMAHLSGDAALIEAFRSGEDIHTATARRVFGIGGTPPPEMRARAKVVNFGIMYGMGARSLAQQMGAGLAEAEEFIRSYFRAYSGVRDYLDATLAEARRRGYVQTLLGRRRWLPELAATHGGQRALAERVAINTPIQGTAADLMKLAMIRVHAALKRLHPSARLLLQVHDELLLECPAAEAEAVSELVRAEMESVATLRVPLRASAGIGASWLDVH